MVYSRSFQTATELVPFCSSPHCVLPIDRLAQTSSAGFKNTRLTRLYEELVRPVLDQRDAFLDATRYVCRALDDTETLLHKQVRDIVNFSYNSRYLHDRLEFEDVSFRTEKKSHVFAVGQQVGSHPLVLATARAVVDDELDCYELFTGVEKPTKAAEFVRFAFHPLLDAAGKDERTKPYRPLLDLHKRYLFRRLLRTMFAYMEKQEIRTVFAIVPLHVKVFLEQTGFRLTGVPTAVPDMSDKHAFMRQAFQKYWRPDAETSRQPALYTIDFRLSPLVRIVDGQSILIDQD
jgi:hypothetical protein